MQRFALVAALVAAVSVSPALAQSNTDASSAAVSRALDSAPLAPGAGLLAHVQFATRVANPDTTPAFLLNFVATGPAQTGVPCYNCVKGVQTTFNVGLTGPYNYVLKSENWQYATSFTTITFTGSCKIAWTIMAGQKVIDSFSVTAMNLVAQGTYIYGANRLRPVFSGAATVTTKLTCKAGSQTTSAPMYFQ